MVSESSPRRHFAKTSPVWLTHNYPAYTMAPSEWEVNMSVARLCVAAFAIVVFNSAAADRLASTVAVKGKTPPDGWAAVSPREEIKPQFAFEPASGHNGTG